MLLWKTLEGENGYVGCVVRKDKAPQHTNGSVKKHREHVGKQVSITFSLLYLH
jgi:hypothetical protein